MRHARRHGNAGHEFGGSGEDSFVAVVVTKLTGALLFILLLTMVIMALLPKAVDQPGGGKSPADGGEPPTLAITTPETLPEAIAGRPYVLALAATGGRGPLKWSLAGPVPEGLSLDPGTGRIEGTPTKGTPKPADLTIHVSDGANRDARPTRLLVYQSDRPLSTPVWWKPGIPPIPWRAWLEQGFGFLVLWLVHVVGMNTIGGLQRWAEEAESLRPRSDEASDGPPTSARRFAAYRWSLRLASLSAAVVLGAWLWRHHA